MSNTEHGARIVRKPSGSGAAAPDRRVRRTRKLLHDAFLSLVIEKGYEKTTIQDILDRACGRDLGELILKLTPHHVEAGRQQRFLVLVVHVES